MKDHLLIAVVSLGLSSSPAFAQHFTLKQRKMFKKHVLWTRLIRDTKTTGPDDDGPTSARRRP